MEKSASENSLSLFNFHINIDELFKLGLEINHLWVLYKISVGEPIISSSLNSIPKIEGWLQTLERKSYIKNHQLNPSGADLLAKIRQQESLPSLKNERKEQLSDFDRWWTAYPSNDSFEYKGKKFYGSRGFKVNKEKCKAKFITVIQSGEFTADQMIEALNAEVILKKEKSISDNANRLQFLQNSMTYLNQETYRNFMNMGKIINSAPKEQQTFSL